MSRVTETRPPVRRHGGFALLVTVLMLVLFGTALLLSGHEQITTESRRDVVVEARVNLQGAKDALLVYAVLGGIDSESDSGRPGTLPCPDMSAPEDSDSGSMSITDCGTGPELGRFPVKTLRLSFDRPVPWFALDGQFLNDGTEPINPDQTDSLSGKLKLDGEPGYAAMLIAPGMPLEGQDRTTGSDASAYLERTNAVSGIGDTDETFEYCTNDHDDDALPCNDHVVTITAEEVMNMARRRVVAEVERILIDYYEDSPGNQTLPYAAPLSSGSEQKCSSGEESGLLPLSGSATDCGGDGHLNVCEMPRWIRPIDIVEDFGCDDDVESGNDWLRFIRYDVVDPSCFTPGGECTAVITSDNESISRKVRFE